MSSDWGLMHYCVLGMSVKMCMRKILVSIEVTMMNGRVSLGAAGTGGPVVRALGRHSEGCKI